MQPSTYGGDFVTDGVGGMMLYKTPNGKLGVAFEIEAAICQTITMTLA